MKLKLMKTNFFNDSATMCLKTLLSYFGKEAANESEKSISDNVLEKGLLETANYYGLNCKGFNTDDKLSILQVPCPAIFHLIINDKEKYVIAQKIGQKSIKVFDPTDGVKKFLLKDFFQYWTGIFFLFTKEDNFSSSQNEGVFLPYVHLLKKNKNIISKIFSSSLLLCIFGILFAFYFRFLVDEVLYSEIKSTLNLVSICYLVLLMFQAVLSYARNQLSLMLGVKINLTLVCEFYNHIMKLPLSFFSARKTGEIVSRIRDTDNIRRVLSSTFVSVLIDCVMILVGAIFMVKLGGKLVAVSIVPVLISSLIVILFAKPLKKLIRNSAVSEANKNAGLFETVNGISTIKALSTEKTAFRRNEFLGVDVLKNTVKLESFGNLNITLQSFISGIGTLLIYWVGSHEIFNGSLSLGQLISFVTLSSYFLGPLSRLLTMQPSIQEALVSAERLNEIFKMKEEDFDEEHNLEAENFSSQICFKNVCFSYKPEQKTLNNVSLKINKGEKIAIVGSSGSGKSTFIKLLMKFYKPSSGSIEIDNLDINYLKTSSYRNLFGYVQQDNLLFSGTIAQNITWGLEDCTPSQMQKAAKDAKALDFINSLPNGFKTMVGENGATLSGGEKQRIALARVLIRNPQIIVLDEATASLDSICEKAIMDVINNLYDKTIIIIAHKLSTITNCDRIYVMDNGNLIESGSHKQLLERKSKYKKLWESQYEN